MIWLGKYRQMQVVDDRESRIRTSFQRLEEKEGGLSREAIIDLVTVSYSKSDSIINLQYFRIKDPWDFQWKKQMTFATGLIQTAREIIVLMILSSCLRHEIDSIALWKSVNLTIFTFLYKSFQQTQYIDESIWPQIQPEIVGKFVQNIMWVVNLINSYYIS